MSKPCITHLIFAALLVCTIMEIVLSLTADVIAHVQQEHAIL